MEIKEKHHQIAKNIDLFVKGIQKKGGGEAEILQGIHTYMDSFKQLLDISKNGELDMLSQQYKGLYTFAKLLEKIAKGFQDGRLKPSDY